MKSLIRWFIVGKNPEAHRFVGKSVGSGSEMSDPELLSEGLKTADGAYDAWHVDHLTRDQRMQVVLAARRRRLPVFLYRQVDDGAPRRFDAVDESAVRRSTLGASPARAKALARLEELKRARAGFGSQVNAARRFMRGRRSTAPADA